MELNQVIAIEVKQNNLSCTEPIFTSVRLIDIQQKHAEHSLKETNMKHQLLKPVTALALAGTMSCAFAESFPSYGISMLDHERAGATPVMKVTANGDKYNKASSASITFKMKSKGRCQSLHSIGKTSVSLQKNINGLYNDVVLKDIIAIKKKTINQKTWSNSWLQQSMTISPKSFLKDKAIKACNNALGKELLKGKSKEDVLKRGLLTKINVLTSKAIMRCHGPSSNTGHPRNVEVDQPVTVQCDKYIALTTPTPPKAPPRAIPKLELTYVDIALNKTKHVGTCPVNLKATAMVKTNKVAGDFDYRFLIDGKPASNWKKAQAKKGIPTVKFFHNFVHKASKAAGGNQGNFKAQNTTHKINIQIKNGNKTLSDFKDYSVDCKTPKIAKLVKAEKPDLTSRKGITIGGQSSHWGGSLNLAMSDTLSTSPRGCKVRFKYDVLNLGSKNVKPATNRLRIGNKSIHSISNFKLNKNQSKNVSGQILLPQGNYDLFARIDESKNVDEKKENNNTFKVRVNVPEQCGGKTPTAAPQ